MGIRKLKAITPGQRFRVVNDFATITISEPEKSLLGTKKVVEVEITQGR